MKNTPKDEDLIRRLQRENPNREIQRAAIELYRYVLPSLWQMVGRRNDKVDKDELEYLIHFTIADLIELIQVRKYPASVPLKTYARGMLDKKILNALRTRKRENERIGMTSWLMEVALEPTPEQIIISKERMAHIEKCFRQLTRQCQDLIELVMEEKSHQEIATVLECKIESVKVILYRCRKNLFNRIKASSYGS